MFSNNEFSIIEFDCYIRERTVLILLSFIKKNRESIRDATAELQVKLDSCFHDLSMLCAKYQSSGIAGSQEEDF